MFFQKQALEFFAKIILYFKKQRKKIYFTDFAKDKKGLSIQLLFDYYTVFDGFEASEYEDIFSSIQKDILENYCLINTSFDFDKLTNKALILLAKNNRKRYSINRKIGHFKANSIINKLLHSGILVLEKSKEHKITRNKHQKLKKALRGYTIQDKVLFKNHFTRFFFRFLKPNEDLILKGDFEKVLKEIKENFEHYQSLCFELLSKEFLEKRFAITDISSFWQKELELDLYYKSPKLSLIGEVKFKNRKSCKNILNLLKNKAETLKIKPDYYIIFSKNGFSSKLLHSKEQNLLLFDLNDFKELLSN